MTHLIRTFYPVGFGAFYTEKHESDDGTTMTIVYDCGTSSQQTLLEKAIKEQFPKPNMVIDILFISHFHKDHISGIPFLKQYCRIKKVVIPYIPKEDRALFAYSNSELESYEQLVMDTEAYFGGDTKILRIASEQFEGRQNNDHEEIFRSGVKLPVGLPISSDWFFIPFNYDYQEQISILKDKLREKGVNYESLANTDYILDRYEEIREVYTSLYSGDKQNEISLAVFSGTDSNWWGMLCYRKRDVFYVRCCFNLNCLYLGDASLKKATFISCLNKRLNECMRRVEIGIIQVPHHGSVRNFDAAILMPGVLSIISCNFRKYELPSASVLRDIIEAGAYPIAVTEKPNSIFREMGYY